MAKKKITNEPIVDVQEVYTKTELFVDKNRKVLSVLLAIIALAFAGFAGWQQLVVAPRLVEAQNSIWKAQQYFEIDSVQKARFGDGYYDGFETIVEDEEGTKVAQLAHYYLGILDRNDAEYESAIDHFMACDLDDNAIGVIALGGIGDCYVELGEYIEAATWFEKAATKAKTCTSENFSAPMFLYKAGIAYFESEDFAKSKAMFSDITENYSNSSENDIATKFVGRLSQY